MGIICLCPNLPLMHELRVRLGCNLSGLEVLYPQHPQA